MRDRLTLKAGTHQTDDQAADPDDRPSSQAPGQRQPQELQTAFLTDMLDRMVTVYLVSGIKLTGKVRQHDQPIDWDEERTPLFRRSPCR